MYKVGNDVQNTILYDWVSITSKIHSLADIIEAIGLTSAPWQSSDKGAHGFKYRMYFESISIFYGRDDEFVFLDMSGQGCRAFESYGNGDYEGLFQMVLDEPDDVHITRLDIAYDDKVGLLQLDTLGDNTLCNNFVSCIKQYTVVNGNKERAVNFGSRQSEVYIRIYDKALERGFEDGRHWVRFEVQLRRDRALAFISAAGTIGDKFFGVVNHYLRFVEPCSDSNKRRWPITSFWANFVNDCADISLYIKPGVEYNLKNLNNFVFSQAGNGIDAALQIYGLQGFLEELQNRVIKQNPKYVRLIEQYAGE